MLVDIVYYKYSVYVILQKLLQNCIFTKYPAFTPITLKDIMVRYKRNDFGVGVVPQAIMLS